MLSGLAVGALVGLTGVGGGSLMTPLLVLLFGIHPATAVGTDLLYAGVTKISGSTVHGAHGSIEWRVVRRLAGGQRPRSDPDPAGAGAFRRPERRTQVARSRPPLGFALLLTSVSLLFRPWLVARAAAILRERSERQIAWLTVALGAALGVLVSITSVGAGAIGVTVLLMLYPRMPTLRIVGSDIAHAVPLTLIAGSGHWLIGSIDWVLLVSLLAGSIPGIAISQPFRRPRPRSRLAHLAGRHAGAGRREVGVLSRRLIS